MENKNNAKESNPHADAFQLYVGDYARVVGINEIQTRMAAGVRVIEPEDLLRCCDQIVMILSVKKLSELHFQYEVDYFGRRYHIQGIFLSPYSKAIRLY